MSNKAKTYLTIIVYFGLLALPIHSAGLTIRDWEWWAIVVLSAMYGTAREVFAENVPR